MPVLLNTRFVDLYTLHLRSGAWHSKIFNNAMIERFVVHLPDSLTSLDLPSWINSGDELAMLLPPLNVMRNLQIFSWFESGGAMPFCTFAPPDSKAISVDSAHKELMDFALLQMTHLGPMFTSKGSDLSFSSV